MGGREAPWGFLSPRSKGLIRPFKGLIRALKGLIRPLKGLIRPFKVLIKPFKGPLEAMRSTGAPWEGPLGDIFVIHNF